MLLLLPFCPAILEAVLVTSESDAKGENIVIFCTHLLKILQLSDHYTVQSTASTSATPRPRMRYISPISSATFNISSTPISLCYCAVLSSSSSCSLLGVELSNAICLVKRLDSYRAYRY